jgi:hypothetical protein
MTYRAIVEMARSVSLQQRCAAAAAEQGVTSPDQWVTMRIWQFAASPGWADKWQYATDEITINQQPDLGIRDDVISDGDILAAVQALNAP